MLDCFLKVIIEKQLAPAAAPVAAIQSNRLLVDNDQMRNDLSDLDDVRSVSKRNISGKIKAQTDLSCS